MKTPTTRPSPQPRVRDFADVIYLSFDGLTDPLGRSQVLPYLAGLARCGNSIRIVSLEKADAFQRGAAIVRDICASAGIEWHPLPYQIWPPIVSAVLNLRALRRAARRLHRQRPANLIHARSDLPGIAGLALKHRDGLPLLYDMRAFWPDERAEGGAWDQSKLLYRLIFRHFKRKQCELLATADEVVTLSEAGKLAIHESGMRTPEQPTTVIPCCADFELFLPPLLEQRAQVRSMLRVADDAPLLVHLGSIGCNCLLNEMLDFFAIYQERHAAARFLFVAPSGENIILAEVRARAIDGAVEVRSAQREEVPRLLGAADLGIMFVRPSWSKRAASPTKLGEMLAIGLPVIANTGVGDVADVIRQANAGVVVDHFHPEGYRRALDELEGQPRTREDIRNQGRRVFDLQGGIGSYDAIYSRLVSVENA